MQIEGGRRLLRRLLPWLTNRLAGWLADQLAANDAHFLLPRLSAQTAKQNRLRAVGSDWKLAIQRQLQWEGLSFSLCSLD